MTAIVIGLAVTAVMLAYAIRLYQAKQTLSIDAFTDSKRREPPSPTQYLHLGPGRRVSDPPSKPARQDVGRRGLHRGIGSDDADLGVLRGSPVLRRRTNRNPDRRLDTSVLSDQSRMGLAEAFAATSVNLICLLGVYFVREKYTAMLSIW